jgi:predicted GIY-YIG superfamily endonuclease
MLTNCSRHPIYTGVTRAMRERLACHKDPHEDDTYTSRYKLYRLVYVEQFKT